MRPFEGTWMELEMIILHEVSQTEKDKYDITCMWNLKYDINEPTYLGNTNRIQTEKRLVATKREEEVGEGQTGDFGLENANYCTEDG